MSTRANILLVEDDVNMSFLLNENLKSHGYDITSCKDGEAGWEAFGQGNYDLCILDVMLPRRDGFSLAQGIRKQNRQIPIIFLTAKSMLPDKVNGFELGCDDYITKPF